MPLSFPAPQLHRINAPVLGRVNDLSAHSDVAEPLLTAVKPLGEAQVFCPDARAYRYVVVSTNTIIFGLAVGMNTIAFRLDPRMKLRALVTGAKAYPECGADWVSVLPLGSDAGWPAVVVVSGSEILGLANLCLRARNQTGRIGRNFSRQLRRLALTRWPARLPVMKLFLAIFVYLLIGAVLSWGILLALAGKPWLLAGGLIAYIVAFGKIGCTSH